MIKIEKELKPLAITLNNTAYIHYQPRINGLVIFNGQKAYTINEFILDTGASITILNAKFNFLFKDTKPQSYTRIMYGGSTKDLPVYDIELKIEGNLFNLKAAHDSEMELTSLLGHFDFLNTFNHFSISMDRHKFILVKN
jgi:hypothetical protein